jgi:Mn2+/Fe2+ NRAMP family transporter
MNVFQRLKNNRAFSQLAIFLSILGPGIITGSVDNDAGGITTYSMATNCFGRSSLRSSPSLPCRK